MSIASEISRIQQNVTDSLSAVANKGVTVPAGSNSDDLPDLISQIQAGAGSAITITDTTDSHGGTIRTITAVSLAGDTVSAEHLESGYTAHNSLGEAITGTMPPGGQPNLQDKTNIAPTESSQTITADTGYDGLNSVQINAVSSTYVGSGINRRSSSDLTSSGANVYVPAGYYASQAQTFVQAGTAGTPTATKGTVSGNKVTVTPSVTNTSGYITGSTKTGSAVTVEASDLVAGTINVPSGSTVDCTNYQYATNTGGGSVSIGSKSVTSSNNSTSITFSSLSGQPKYAYVHVTSTITSSGNTTYYYIVDIFYNGSSAIGNYFRIGGTRAVYSMTTGNVSVSKTSNSITFTSSATSRSAAPGAFYNGTYELYYIY